MRVMDTGICSKMFVFVILVTCTWIDKETSVVGEPICNVPLPCTCSIGVITYMECSSNQLTAIPAITIVGTTQSMLDMDFGSNKLTTLHSKAFQNVDFPEVYLHFSSNLITTISDTAFDGIENTTTYLHIANNKLTYIPSAIGRLRNIETLYVYNNPIMTLDANVLVMLGGILTKFEISLEHMTKWPAEMSLLSKLEVLDIEDVHFTSLPSLAFNGFETTLRRLSISRTSLRGIPESVCKLRHLKAFTFSYNTALNGHLVLENLCPDPLTEVTELRLRDNSIRTIDDDLFTTFPALTFLTLDDNLLQDIPEQEIPQQSNITLLSLSSNGFNKVPFALRRFKMLENLYLDGNKLSYIRYNDFLYLPHLSSLNLNHNPIVNIDHGAFRMQSESLRSIYLGYTNLDTIPTAVVGLKRLSSLDVQRSTTGIKCSCENMLYLHAWNVFNIYLYGNCANTSESIKDYILNSLPSCMPTTQISTFTNSITGLPTSNSKASTPLSSVPTDKIFSSTSSPELTSHVVDGPMISTNVTSNAYFPRQTPDSFVILAACWYFFCLLLL